MKQQTNAKKLTFEEHCKLIDEKLALEKRAIELYSKENSSELTKEEFKESLANMRRRDEIREIIFLNHWRFNPIKANREIDAQLRAENQEVNA
jgi:hypothetical protein